jgi:hypothetical protein
MNTTLHYHLDVIIIPHAVPTAAQYYSLPCHKYPQTYKNQMILQLTLIPRNPLLSTFIVTKSTRLLAGQVNAFVLNMKTATVAMFLAACRLQYL